MKTAVERADLSDIDPAGYMSLLIQLANYDVNTGVLTVKYLSQPDPNRGRAPALNDA